MAGALEIFGAGQLDVLSVGRGHLKLTITEGDEVEKDKARRIIEDMMQRGFAIFIEHEDGTTSRVKAFDPERFVYLIDDTMDSVPAAKAPPRKRPAAPKPGPRPTKSVPAKARRSLKAVPVTEGRATAVGRTAGG